jgi:hypothetical protein
MPVEALWRWLREDVTYHHCHPTAEDLSRRVAAFETRLNQDAFAVADRLKDCLDPDEEKLALQLQVPFSPKIHPSFCTCSVRVLCELGSEKGTNRRSKEDSATLSHHKLSSATVMLGPVVI